MSMKYCFNCTEEIPDMQARQCPQCGAQTFAHNKDVVSSAESRSPATSDQVDFQPKDSSVQNEVVAHESEIIRSNESKYLEQILERLNSTEREIQKIQKENISAQNRTTHSVRAFVRFLFIQLSATSAAAVLWGLASAQVDPVACAQSGEHCSPVGALQAFAIIIWILGVIWSSSAGWEELEKSKIPR